MDDMRIYASDYAGGQEESIRAVVISPHPQLVMTLSIGQARDVANRLAKAADEAEAKLQK